MACLNTNRKICALKHSLKNTFSDRARIKNVLANKDLDFEQEAILSEVLDGIPLRDRMAALAEITDQNEFLNEFIKLRDLFLNCRNNTSSDYLLQKE